MIDVMCRILHFDIAGIIGEIQRDMQRCVPTTMHTDSSVTESVAASISQELI
jgi:hypothetical protein